MSGLSDRLHVLARQARGISEELAALERRANRTGEGLSHRAVFTRSGLNEAADELVEMAKGCE